MTSEALKNGEEKEHEEQEEEDLWSSIIREAAVD